MYIPRPWHNILPFGLMIVGLYLGHNLDTTYDVFLAVVVCEFHAAMLAWYINVSAMLYQKYLTNVDSKQDSIIVKPNQTQARNIPMFEQTIVQPKIWKERYLAFMIVKQYQNGFPEDLRETKWLGTQVFKKGERFEFVAIIKKWNDAGVIARTSNKRNATYYVADKRLLEHVSIGGELPQKRE